LECCAAGDVHKKTVVVCRVRRGEQETRTFGTTTRELLQLLDWVLAWGCTHFAMESTGEYWKPVYNILEGNLEVWLVNARHVKAVPGRKTDVQDAEWLADLLRHGLLRPSFIPPRGQRELRDLTRQRSTLVRERASVVNRLQKVLEDANLKLASVVSDVTGVSARAMLEQIIAASGGAGANDPAAWAELARGRLRSKRAELEQALTGRVRAHHGFLLQQHLLHLDFLDEQIGAFDHAIDQHVQTLSSPPPTASAPPPTPASTPPAAAPPVTFAQAVQLLDTIPGVNRALAEVIVAEIGPDMSRFPSAEHLASWAGVAPGNNQSAGKQRSGRTNPGNRALRTGLVQGAQAVARAKDTYLATLYHRLAARRGKKRAILAVAHAMLVSIYHMLTRRQPYHDLGANYFDERKRESVTHHLVHRLEKLGYTVALEVPPQPASAAA
jgi:transposase